MDLLCFCSVCIQRYGPDGNKKLKYRTIVKHIKLDKEQLQNRMQLYFPRGYEEDERVKELEQCIIKTQRIIDSQPNPSNSRVEPPPTSNIHELHSVDTDTIPLQTQSDTLHSSGVAQSVNSTPSQRHENMDILFLETDIDLGEESEDVAHWPSSDEDDDDDGSSSDSDSEIDLEEQATGAINFGAQTASNPTCQAITDLHTQLLNGYKCPPVPPDVVHSRRSLSDIEKLSLQHYFAWSRSNGTVKAYKLHANVLSLASQKEVYSLHRVRKLAQGLTLFFASKRDMCPRSCIAYTGQYKDLTSCPYVHKKHGRCNEPRYRNSASGKQIPRAQVSVLPVKETIRAMFSNEETSNALLYRDRCLKEALNLVGTTLYSDYANSAIHKIQVNHLNLFEDPRDIALALSTDGAQLTMKKQSNTWVLILIILNLPPNLRYKSNNIIINLAIPGPNSPGDVESFLWPLFEEMAQGSEGIWMQDALHEAAYFKNRMHITMGLGDMLGSAKVNGMAGHSALHGDRFSMVPGARNSITSGSKAQYYPISPPKNDTYNPTRPATIDLKNIPMRTHIQYLEVLKKLSNPNLTNAQRKAIVKASGISKLPLIATSKAFLHPSASPMDPFHLYYENIMTFMYDLWVSLSDPSESVHLSDSKARKFGEFIQMANETLPPAFCGAIRNPYLKRQSQYKIYEWMALLHWYTIPILLELEFNPTVLENFSKFAYIVEYTMTVQPRSDEDLKRLHIVIEGFLKGFESLYIGDDPTKINRARLCIFQLIHVPQHVRWNGSIRLGSQATMERTLGQLGHRIRSRKSPFANLSNIIYEKELQRILVLHYPEVDLESENNPSVSVTATRKLSLSQRLTMNDSRFLDTITRHTDFLTAWYLDKFPGDRNNIDSFLRWGCLHLPNGQTLRSRASELKGNPPLRCSRWFEASTSEQNNSSATIFGEALAFYQVRLKNSMDLDSPDGFLIYRPIEKVKTVLRISLCGTWSEPDCIRVIPTRNINSIVGILDSPISEAVYILRKHPTLEILSEEERGLSEDFGGGGEYEGDYEY